MQTINAIFSNVILVSAAISWFAAEIIKMIGKCIHAKSIKVIRFKDLFASGGMPSSHSAAVCALMASIGYVVGVQTPYFAITAVLAVVVMYDASGVRRETGKQSKALNMIMRDMFSGNPEYSNSAFKELIGHTKSQVFMGALLGISLGILYPYLLGA